MTCAHQIEPLATSPFQVRRDAAWLMDYCKRCGERHWYVRGPHVNELEEQPRP